MKNTVKLSLGLCASALALSFASAGLAAAPASILDGITNAGGLDGSYSQLDDASLHNDADLAYEDFEDWCRARDESTKYPSRFNSSNNDDARPSSFKTQRSRGAYKPNAR